MNGSGNGRNGNGSGHGSGTTNADWLDGSEWLDLPNQVRGRWEPEPAP